MFDPRAVRLQYVARCLFVTVVVLAFQTTTARAEFDPQWGSKMFDQTEIKFGPVARGADAVIQVRVKNIYQENIEITSVTTGCSCVGWDEAKKDPYPFPIVIPSNQTQVLNLRLNTVQFEGQRTSKAFVSLMDRVHNVSTLVELPVDAYIRRDIVVTPGAVNFGTVDEGVGAERKVDIQYAGRNDWKLSPAKSNHSHLTVALRETGRGSGRVTYELLVTLKPSAPLGTLRDQVVMVTDDANNPQIAILVEAKVEPEFNATDLQFGAIAQGQSKMIPVIVRGKRPFQIQSLIRIEKANGALNEAFTVRKLEKVSQTVHSLPITLHAPEAPGVFEEEFELKIVDRPQPIIFKARGRILAAPAAAAPKD